MTARSTPARLLLVTLDPGRGLALLRGPAADRAAWLLTTDTAPPQRAAAGWVVPHAVGVDATGWAQAMGVICRVSSVPTGQVAR